MWDGFDKRRFPRLALRCEVSVQVGPKKGRPLSTITQNVGLGGICVVLRRSYDRFSACHVKVDLGAKHPKFESKGRIVWNIKTTKPGKKTGEYDTGIEFVDPSEENMDRLRKFLDANSNKGFHEVKT